MDVRTPSDITNWMYVYMSYKHILAGNDRWMIKETLLVPYTI